MMTLLVGAAHARLMVPVGLFIYIAALVARRILKTARFPRQGRGRASGSDFSLRGIFFDLPRAKWAFVRRA